MQDLNDMLFFAEVVDRGGFAAAAVWLRSASGSSPSAT